jgi:PBSX family phage terminase large subunit
LVGYSLGTIYKNIILLLFNSTELSLFRPFCSWSAGNHCLTFGQKSVFCIGAGDEGALGLIQGLTIDLCYCDEMTLYPDNVIDMLKTRLSRQHSQLFASMNPKHPGHKLKKWVDWAEEGDPNYYALHFTLDDNPYVDQSYKEDLRKSLSGLFYKRNYLGLWVLADGAVYDFFDRDIHVVKKPPAAAEYWIASIDYGAVNPFCCLLLGVSTGRYTQSGHKIWVEKEYYYDPKIEGKQKTNFEFAEDIQKFLAPYYIRGIYIDPSAAAFKEELRRKKMQVIDANNEVEYGIQKVSTELMSGNLTILQDCINLCREIEGYVWDTKKSDRGNEEPVKRNDHACVTSETKIRLLTKDVPIRELTTYYHEMRIQNFNPRTEQIEEDLVLNVELTRPSSELLELSLMDGRILRATPDHFILTERGWVPMNGILVTDKVLTCIYAPSGPKQTEIQGTEFISVRRIGKLKGKKPVYCIGTQKHGTMIANGIVTKNCDALRYAVATHKVVKTSVLDSDTVQQPGYRRW